MPTNVSLNADKGMAGMLKQNMSEVLAPQHPVTGRISRLTARLGHLCNICQCVEVEYGEDPGDKEVGTEARNAMVSKNPELQDGQFGKVTRCYHDRPTQNVISFEEKAYRDEVEYFRQQTSRVDSSDESSFQDENRHPVRIAIDKLLQPRNNDLCSQSRHPTGFVVEYRSTGTNPMEFLRGWRVDETISKGNIGCIQIISFGNRCQGCILKIRNYERNPRESSILAECQSVFVTKLMASLLRQGLRYMFFKGYELGDLRYWLGKDVCRRAFVEEIAVWVTARLYAAIDFLHRRGIVHFNIRTDHIFIDDFGYPVLGGFSRAKRIGNKSGSLEEVTIEEDAILSQKPIDNNQHDKLNDLWGIACCFCEIVNASNPNCPERQGYSTKSSSIIENKGPSLSSAAREFLRQELSPDLEKRLGFPGGALAVTQHELFDGINWEDIRSGIHQRTSPLLTALKTVTENFSSVDDMTNVEDIRDMTERDTASVSSLSTQSCDTEIDTPFVIRTRKTQRTKEGTVRKIEQNKEEEGYLADVDSEIY